MPPKHLEKAVRETRGRFAHGPAMAQIGCWRWDFGANRIAVCDDARRLMGFERGVREVPFEALISTAIHPSDRERVKRAGAIAARLRRARPLEFRVVRPDGAERVVLSLGTHVSDTAGRATGMIGTVQDITDRRQNDEELRVSLAKYSALFDSFPLGVTVTDQHGKVLETNREAARLLDVPAEEHIKRHIDGPEWRIIRPDGTTMPPEEYASVRALKEQRRVENVEMGIVKPDGQVTWITVTAAPLRLEGYGGVITYSDITERKRAEEEVRRTHEQLRALAQHLERVREEERARLAREIHDELGYLLTEAKMDLVALCKSLPRIPGAPGHRRFREKVKDITAVLDKAVERARKIATDLRPGILDDLGLGPAIAWLVGRFQRSSGIQCKVKCDVSAFSLGAERSTAMFRICQELLTNVARHAQATRLQVALREETNCLILEVKDNGRGIAPGKVSAPTSLGLIGIRERVLLMRGEFTISGSAREGTRAVVRVPVQRDDREIVGNENPDRGRPRGLPARAEGDPRG